jgi:hypothetical protein
MSRSVVKFPDSRVPEAVEAVNRLQRLAALIEGASHQDKEAAMTEPTEAEVRARDAEAWPFAERILRDRHEVAPSLPDGDLLSGMADRHFLLALLAAERDSQAARDGRALAALREATPETYIIQGQAASLFDVAIREAWGKVDVTGTGPTIELVALAALAALEGRG